MQLQQHLVIRAILYIFPLSLHDNMFLVNFNLFVVMIHSVFQGGDYEYRTLQHRVECELDI